ncbi:plectin-like isoform X2 [Schistocerca gregaria]|uniref:plectin-like isoform X2 n=1 Tax=Schistocerca gregaria TaxID=7010 RepID=UPI00211F2E1C|nr:plectin-like isoform X2 [Schistocerca gregaria]
MQMGDYEDVGLSLFRGMDTIQIDQDNEHLEQEAAEEQRRRNEELRSILKQTFADLSFDDDDEEDDDDEDDSGADDSDVNSSDSDDSRCRNNERQHQGEIQAFAQTVLEESRILPPRPVTEGSVMFPENGHLTPQWDASTNSELPPKICKESGELHRGSPESSPGRWPRLSARAADAGSVTPAPATAAVSDPNELYRQAGYESAEQLRVLYEVRTREVQRLSQEAEAARAEAAAEVDGLRRRIVSCEADKNGLQLQLGNARSLLAEHKGRTEELEDEVETMKRNIFNLENSKKQLETQLAAAQASVVELQHKVLLLERSRLGDGRDALRELEGRHRSDVDALRRQLHECDARLREQEKEAAEREGRLREQNREQERLLVEKGEAVAALARQLEEAQRGLGRAGALRAEAEEARRDARRAAQQLEATQRELEQLKSELKQYEVLDSLGLLSAGGDSAVDRGVRDSRGGPGGGFHAELRRELQRSLAGQKAKREEIRRLQEQLRERDRQLCERDRQVAALQRQQELYLQEAGKFKDEVDKLYAQLAHRDSADGCADPDAEAARRDAETRRAELEKAKAEARDLAERLAAAEAELREAQGHAEGNGREEFLRFHEQAVAKMKREHEERVAALQCQLEKAAEECDRVKQMYVEVCGSKELLLQGVEEERASWEAERAELRSEAAQLRARLDLYAGRVSREIDRAKEAAIAAVAAEDSKQPETCSVSVQATASPLPSPVPGGDGCASCEALRQRASFLEGRTEGLTEELCRRQAELRESRGRAASLQRELAQLAEKRESLEAEIVQYKQRLKDASQSQEEVKVEEGQLVSEAWQSVRSEERREAGRRAAALEAETERLTGELARAVAECGAARQREESLQQELAACRAEVEAGAGASGCDAEEAARLRERLEEVERHVAESERRAAEVSVKLTAELTAARGLCEQLADRLQEGRVDKKDSETCTEWEYPDLEQLVARHREEIERIKDQTVDYFANQVLQLQEQHCASLAKAEQLYAESLQAARLAVVEAREEAAAARLGKEETEKHLVHVQKTLSEVKADFARVRNKYHTAKKVVHDYKVWAQKREEQCRQEWRRLEEGYRASLLELQQRMDRVLDQKGKQQAPQDNS